jgi:hypothetical protein
MRIVGSSCAEASFHRILLEVGSPEIVVTGIADVMTRISVLPHREAGMKLVGKSTLDEADASFQRGVLSCKQEVHVIGHNDKGVELVTALVTIALESGDEEFGVCSDVKESAAIEGRCCDEVSAWDFTVGGDGHGGDGTAKRRRTM